MSADLQVGIERTNWPSARKAGDRIRGTCLKLLGKRDQLPDSTETHIFATETAIPYNGSFYQNALTGFRLIRRPR